MLVLKLIHIYIKKKVKWILHRHANALNVHKKKSIQFSSEESTSHRAQNNGGSFVLIEMPVSSCALWLRTNTHTPTKNSSTCSAICLSKTCTTFAWWCIESMIYFCRKITVHFEVTKRAHKKFTICC